MKRRFKISKYIGTKSVLRFGFKVNFQNAGV